MKTVVSHEFDPVYNDESRILLLGTIPSPKSRELGFYYTHPRNRFWKVLATVFSQDTPVTINDKKDFLYKNKIALWDVLASCRINNADDSTISEPVANDLSCIFNRSAIQAVFTTGKKAAFLFEKHCNCNLKPICLPSTSPANCAVSLNELIEAYKIILDYLQP